MSQNGNSPEPAVEDQEAAGNGVKKTKTDKRKEKKQKQKQNKQLRRQQQDERLAGKAQTGQEEVKAEEGDDEKIIVEYVSAPLDFEAAPQATGEDQDMVGLGYGMDKPQEDPFSEFKRVFEKFASAEQVTGLVPLGDDGDGDDEGNKDVKGDDKAGAGDKDSDDADDEDGGEGAGSKLTKKERKALAQLKIAQLKQQCERPDVVEVWDVTSQDPQLLVYLKAYRNTVPVPRHWSQKRKYLQGKRGLEKPPFKLPDFIEATGIGTMRQAYQEKEEAKKLKQKARERMQPKMGRMDIDYQVLHDAFFKYQTRPKLTPLGDMYYEGKEFEARVENAKPGILSSDLKTALGMTDSAPPPWLINMQRYGPPPSYPNLRIPGLNAPIPAGCQFGYHAGGWGKPPVDEEGNPLYGDVFGAAVQEVESDEEVDKGHQWGELEPDLEESSEEQEEEEEEEEQDEEALEDGIASGMVSGLTTGGVSGMVSGIASSLPSGIETPDVSINLRKGNDSIEPPRLYTVLEQKAAPLGQNTLLGTEHVYVIPGQEKTKKTGGPARPGATDIEVTLSPEEMEGLDEAGIKDLYERKVAEARAADRHDFSDMVAERAAQQKRKMQQKADAAKKQKTGKDFKF